MHIGYSLKRLAKAIGVVVLLNLCIVSVLVISSLQNQEKIKDRLQQATAKSAVQSIDAQTLKPTLTLKNSKRLIYKLPEDNPDETDRKVAELIKQLDEMDTATALKAADELMKIGKPALQQLIDKLAENPSLDLKDRIVFLLGRMGYREAVPAIIDILRNETNSYLKSDAAAALGNIKDEKAIDYLCAALMDDNFMVRSTASWALGEIRDTRAVDSLLNRMIDEKANEVRIEIINAFGKIKDPRSLDLLTAELDSGGDLFYNNEVVAALGEIADRRALPAVDTYLAQLKENNLQGTIFEFEWQEAIRIAEEAINKINNKT